MKKLSILGLALVLIVAVLAMTAFSGEQCSADKNAVKASSSTKACSSGDKVNATKASATTTGAACTDAEMAACAKSMGVSKEECAKMCADGKFTMQTISIKGMTCGGCESSVTTALEKIAGVQKVVSISHKDERAVVCVDPTKCTDTGMLTKAIADKGFKAEIIPAVIKTSSTGAAAPHACSTTKEKDASSCAKTCSPKEKAACDAKAKTDSKDESK